MTRNAAINGSRSPRPASETPVVYEPSDPMQVGFLASAADIAIFGGRAGCGKTATALMAAGQHVDLPGYGAVIFRRLVPHLFGAGSVWQQARKFYPFLDGAPVRTPHAEWRFPAQATVEFLGMQYLGDEEQHQGKRYTCVVFEEVTQFEAPMFWYLFGRVDDLKDDQGRVICKGHMRATCNPDADSFVRELIDWWIDSAGFAIPERAGVLRWFIRHPAKDGTDKDTLEWYSSVSEAKAAWPKIRAWSLTYFPGIPSKHMGESYQDRLDNLSLVKRSRMRDANWNIREEAGTILKREWFPVVDTLPSSALRYVRGWDKGAVAGGDATEGAKVADLGAGRGWAIVDFASSRSTPGERKEKLLATAKADGSEILQCIWQDPGSSGVYDALGTQADFRAVGSHCTIVPASKSKLVYAEAWSTLAEHGFRGLGPRIYVLRAPWNDALFSEMDAFDGKEGRVDNKIDATSRAFLELLQAKDSSTYTPPVRPVTKLSLA